MFNVEITMFFFIRVENNNVTKMFNVDLKKKNEEEEEDVENKHIKRGPKKKGQK